MCGILALILGNVECDDAALDLHDGLYAPQHRGQVRSYYAHVAAEWHCFIGFLPSTELIHSPLSRMPVASLYPTVQDASFRARERGLH